MSPVVKQEPVRRTKYLQRDEASLSHALLPRGSCLGVLGHPWRVRLVRGEQMGEANAFVTRAIWGAHGVRTHGIRTVHLQAAADGTASLLLRELLLIALGLLPARSLRAVVLRPLPRAAITLGLAVLLGFLVFIEL